MATTLAKKDAELMSPWPSLAKLGEEGEQMGQYPVPSSGDPAIWLSECEFADHVC